MRGFWSWYFVFFICSAAALPLQWEQLLPSGFSPDARYDAAGCLFSDMETSPILYGGIYFDSSGREEPRALDGCTGTPCQNGNVHAFDVISHGWDVIQITAQNYPMARGGHTMTSIGSHALVCGGYQPTAASSLTTYERQKGIFQKTMLTAPDGVSLDCWWLRVLPDAAWERLTVSTSIAPPSRSYHAAVHDARQNNVIIFGGEGPGRRLLNDCWFMSYQPATGNATFSGAWSRCELAIAGPKPAPRRGHSVVVYSGVVFLFGGFALSSVPGGRDAEASVNDVWSLSNYAAATREWQEMTPLSVKPAKRAFHAAWMIGGEEGFKMIVHGGQSDEGEGENSVVGDTWRLDLSTNVWTKYSSDPEAPPVFHAFASSVSNSSAMLFGGKTGANKLFGRVMIFDTTQGWLSVLPAGRRPEKRSGHVVAYDDGAKWMMISHGMNWKGELMDDSWALDVSTGAWTRLFYSARSVRPPKGALSAFASSGAVLFTIGGIAQGGGLVAHSDVWMVLTSTMEWRQVVFQNLTSTHAYPTATSTANNSAWDNAVRPVGRSQAVAVKLDSFGGMLEPVVVLGGKAGHAVDGMPLNDIWVFDSVALDDVPVGTAGPGAPPTVQDSMATFDGADDYIAVPLPEFASRARALSALWIEAWFRMDSRVTEVETLLFDYIYIDNVVLRLVLMAAGNGDDRPMLRLYFFPGSSKQQVIKTWGPLNAGLWSPSAWHHVALTLRFAPISSGQVEPDAIPTQAFLFFDSYRIRDDERFLLMDLKDLRISHGLSKIAIGGTSQSSLSDTFRFFEGDMDSIRIWWIDCPPGPTACNPYGFLYPQQNYPPFKRIPEAGIQDNRVQLKDVAPQILQSMFNETLPANTPGLLVSLDFNSVNNGLVMDSSEWLPDQCTACGEKVCPGCQAQCLYDQCKNFDLDCIEDDGMSNLEFLSEQGSCECLDSVTCPKHVENCQCPRGFVRECETATTGSKGSSKSGDGECRSWFCACKDQLRPTCTRCLLNGLRTTPSDPCLSPSICTSRLCLFPFLSRFDTDTPDGGTPTLNPTEFLQWVNTTLTNYMPVQKSGSPIPRYTSSALLWFAETMQYQPFAGQTQLFFDDNLFYDRKLAWTLFCHADEDADGLLSAGELMKNIFGDTDEDGLVSLRELAAQYRVLWGLKFRFSPDANITQIAGYTQSASCATEQADCSVFSGGDTECEGGYPVHLIDEYELNANSPPGCGCFSKPYTAEDGTALPFIDYHPFEAANHPNFYPDPEQLLLPAALFLSAMNMTAYGSVSFLSAQSLFTIDAVTWIFEGKGAEDVVSPEEIDCKLLLSLENIRCQRGSSSAFGDVGATEDYYDPYGDSYGGYNGYGGYGGYNGGYDGAYGGYGNNYDFNFDLQPPTTEGNYYEYEEYTGDYYGDDTGYQGYAGYTPDFDYYCPESSAAPLTGTFGHIEFVNPGGYRDRSECFWVLTREAGLPSVSLLFQYLDTEECCDKVMVESCEEGRTGFSCTEMGSFGGSMPPSQPALFAIPASPGYLQVRFQSDSSVTAQGFVLQYEKTDQAPTVTDDACPSYQDLGPFGTITYLESGGYKDNADCSWVLPGGFTTLSVEFTTLSTEDCCDKVLLESCREGIVGISCTELQSFAGTALPDAPLTYSTPEDAFVMVRFVSDGSVSAEGFELRFERGNDASTGGGSGGSCPMGEFVQYAGSAAQIDFDRSSDGGYSNDQMCSWLLSGGERYTCFAISFPMIDTEECCDSVIFQVCDWSSCYEAGRAAGTSSGTLYFDVPLGGWLQIEFSSDGSVTSNGFVLEYAHSDQCGTVFPPDLGGGTGISTGGFPGEGQFSTGGGGQFSTGGGGQFSTGGFPGGGQFSFGGGISGGGGQFSFGGFPPFRRRLGHGEAAPRPSPLHPAQQAATPGKTEQSLALRAVRSRARTLTLADYIAGRDPASRRVEQRRAANRRRHVQRVQRESENRREVRSSPLVEGGKGARARGRAMQGRPLRGGSWGSRRVGKGGDKKKEAEWRTETKTAPHTGQRTLQQYDGGYDGKYGEYGYGGFRPFSYPMGFSGGPPENPLESPAPAQRDVYYDWSNQCFEASLTCFARDRGLNEVYLGDCPCLFAGGCPERAQSGAVVSNAASSSTLFAAFAGDATSISAAQLSALVSTYELGQGLAASFSTVDANSDGAISEAELYEFLLKGAHGEADWFLAIFDLDCNGRIGFEEAAKFCVGFDFEMANYDRFFFHQFLTAQMQVADFYEQAVEDLPLCPFKVDATAQEPRPHLTARALGSYLLAMKFVREKDTNQDGRLYFGSDPAVAVEWTLSSGQKAGSTWVTRLGAKNADNVDREYAGPELIFELTMGSPDADGLGSEDVNTPDIQGWPALMVEVCDTDADSKLQEAEAEALLWNTKAYFTYVDTKNGSVTDNAWEASEIGKQDHVKAYLFMAASFYAADTNNDDKINLNEWIAADWDADPTAPSFSSVDTNSDGFVSDIEALHAVSTTSFGGYLRCPFLPCQDCGTWDAGFGGCETYREGEDNHQFCSSDYDQFTIYAIDACPQACLTGNISYLCGVNVQNLSLSTHEPLTTSDGSTFLAMASHTSIPPLALPEGVALATFRVATKFVNPNNAAAGISLIYYKYD